MSVNAPKIIGKLHGVAGLPVMILYSIPQEELLTVQINVLFNCDRTNRFHCCFCSGTATTSTTTTTTTTTTTRPPPPPPPSKKCFPSTAKVKLESGKLVKMSELQIGDQIETGRMVLLTTLLNFVIYFILFMNFIKFKTRV